jgi:hypothetical protein
VKNTSISRIGKNLNIILRSERIMARRRMAVLRNQTGLVAFAGLVAGIGHIMLNVAAFYALRDNMAPQNAALIVGLGNLLLAAALIIAATRMTAEAELEPVSELRDLAISDLESELEGIIEEGRDLSATLRRMASNPVGSLLPVLIGPLVSALMKSTRTTPPPED